MKRFTQELAVRISVSFLVIMLLSIAPDIFAQSKPALTPADYGQWESIGFQTKLSGNGRWLTYQVSMVNDSSDLRIVRLDDGEARIIPFAADATFSPSSLWVAYSTGIAKEQQEKLKKQNKTFHKDVVLINLSTNDSAVIKAISGFSFSPDSRFLALTGYAEKGNGPAILSVRDLQNGTTLNLGNVSESAWSKTGCLLAFIINSSVEGNNSVQLYNPGTGKMEVLSSSDSKFGKLTWSENGVALTVMQQIEDSLFTEKTNKVLAWKDLDKSNYTSVTLDPLKISLLGTELGISENYVAKWNKDLTRVFIGLKQRKLNSEKQPIEIKMPQGVDISDVQVWYSEDERIFPQQRLEANRDKNRTMLAVWYPADGRVIKAATDPMNNTSIIGNGDFVTETDSHPYKWENMFDEGSLWSDLYLINTRTGDRKKIVENARYFFGGSPSGRYLLWFKDKDYWVYDTKDGQATNITTGIKTHFDNVYDDHPGAPKPNGVAGWSKKEDAVLVNSQFDVWKISPDGKKPVQLTNGIKDSVVYRYADLKSNAGRFSFFRRNNNEDEGIDLTQPVYFNINGWWTKKSGYARLDPRGSLIDLIYEDQKLSRLQKADSADVFLVTKENFDLSPNLYTSRSNLKDLKQVSHINGFQKNFGWGHSELIDYNRDKTGEHLQAVLLYPANYNSAKKYPMIVYQYERLSQNVHNYVVPNQTSSYNATVWTQEGYFVLMPDITYEAGNPGLSALRSVMPAVRSVIEKGLIDSTKIGMTGHSFGGYESLFIPTQTNLFAAVAEGSGISNLMGFPGQIHWNQGTPEWSHYETGQFRMGVPPWEDADIYVANSPLNFIQNLNTPMLMYAGTWDGTVDWHQAIHFYNYARRAGKKNVVMLVYPEQNHSAGTTSDKIDYQQRILQWFAYWLKGEPAKKWMTGVSYLDYEQQLKENKVKMPERFK